MELELGMKRAIAQEINLGRKDPREIAERIMAQHDAQWLQSEMLALAADVIEDLARNQLGAERRQSIKALRSRDLKGKNIAVEEVMLRSVWIPTEDLSYPLYKRLADCTAAELRSRADYLDRLAVGVLKQAMWAREVAQRIEDAGVERAGQLSSLPELPENEDLPMLMGEA
jgi:hypothetical protein